MTLSIRPDRRQCGFTLVEILVVIAIVGLLAALVAPDVVSRWRETQSDKARADLASIADQANLFFTRHHRWPTLLELATPDSKGHTWIQYHRDPWGHDYVLRTGDGPMVLLSPGPDGDEGTEDDVLPPPPELPR